MKLPPVLFLLAATVFTACSSHINSPTVARTLEAQRAAFSDPLIARAYNAKPSMRYPAIIAIASSSSTVRDHLRAMSAHGALDSLQTLPQCARVFPLSSLLIRRDEKPDLALREAAAKMHADAVLILAIETQVTDGRIIAPLTELSLGLLPNKRYVLIATALAALVDTRTGYVYGALEQSSAKSGLTMAWGSSEVISRARSKAERDAMEKLFADFPSFWRGVVQNHRR
jgi:hypothetical protein